MTGHQTSYANRKWRSLADAWVRQYPICVLCLVHGQVNMGVNEYHSKQQRNLIVDHIEPHRGDVDLFWDQDNLETLCRYPCHDKDKQGHEARGGTGEAWLQHLHEVMREKRTELIVESYRRWLPERIKEALDVQAVV